MMREYYFSFSDQKYGPFTLEELKKKSIKSNTLIWYSEDDGWKKARDIPELKEIVSHHKKHRSRKKLFYSRQEIVKNLSRLSFNIALLICAGVALYIYGVIFSELSGRDLMEICALWIIPGIYGISGHISIMLKHNKPYIPAFAFSGIAGFIILMII